MRLLVTGGAGYIGSHFVAQALARGYSHIVVVDDLSTGLENRLPEEVLFEKMDLSDGDHVGRLTKILRNGIDAVVHFAAKKVVSDSIYYPEQYFHVNIGSTVNLLSAMREANVTKIVFSSSAAVYGEPREKVVYEQTACKPINPYGQSKLISEIALANASRAWGLQSIALRYFNVAGAANSTLADTTITNLIPAIRNVMTSGETLSIFGSDYPTSDGTCVRDFIHIHDLTDAHLAALQSFITNEQPGFEKYNVGTGQGTSVLEIVNAFQELAGIQLDYEYRDRRKGDPAALTANVDKIERELSWTARYSTDDIVQSVISNPPALKVDRNI